ncbi:hypothetical protein BV898_12012 [Hypsibius exemplaris]|uniref:Zinc finger PHD-type domain-containing protein n=1 Tax=Hypsibius exemplaris TaxID=2072580 RepID=A0A1W0WF96_HYPEX|nr:hypothetical protein BV898_12012 [Hypsibius exemplaris]
MRVVVLQPFSCLYHDPFVLISPSVKSIHLPCKVLLSFLSSHTMDSDGTSISSSGVRMSQRKRKRSRLTNSEYSIDPTCVPLLRVEKRTEIRHLEPREGDKRFKQYRITVGRSKEPPVAVPAASQVISTSALTKLNCTECIAFRRKGGARYARLDDMIRCSSSTCSSGAVHRTCLPHTFREREHNGITCGDCAVCGLCQLPVSTNPPPVGMKWERYVTHTIWCSGCCTCHHLLCAIGSLDAANFNPDEWRCNSCPAPTGPRKKSSQSHPRLLHDTASDYCINRRHRKRMKMAHKAQNRVPSGHFSSLGYPENSPPHTEDMEKEITQCPDDPFEGQSHNPTRVDRKDLARWSIAECAECFDSENSHLADLIRKHSLDGSSLLLISRQQFITLFGLGLGPALKMHYAVSRLRVPSVNIRSGEIFGLACATSDPTGTWYLFEYESPYCTDLFQIPERTAMTPSPRIVTTLISASTLLLALKIGLAASDAPEPMLPFQVVTGPAVFNFQDHGRSILPAGFSFFPPSPMQLQAAEMKPVPVYLPGQVPSRRVARSEAEAIGGLTHNPFFEQSNSNRYIGFYGAHAPVQEAQFPQGRTDEPSEQPLQPMFE